MVNYKVSNKYYLFLFPAKNYAGLGRSETLFYSELYRQFPEQCLADSRFSINTCWTNDFLNHSLYLELSEARIVFINKIYECLKYLTLLFSSTNSIFLTVFLKEEDLVWSIIIFTF